MATVQQTSIYDGVDVAELRKRGTAKWSNHGDDVLAAPVAEMDFTVAPPIHEALLAAVERDCFGYPPGDERTGLTAATARYLGRVGVQVEPRQVQVLPDVLKGLELGIDVFSPGDSAVVVTTPAYPPFFAVAQLLGRKIVEAPMLNDHGYHRFDFEALDRAFATGARTLILCNPHNPLGRMFSREELSKVAENVEAHGARVVTDEVHGPLAYPGATFTPYAAVSTVAANHSVTLTSASKGWNVPGLKCAQLTVTNPDDLPTWQKMHGLRGHGASILGIIPNRVAYDEGGPWLADTVAYLDGNRRLLGDLLRKHLPEVVYAQPEGTYLSWLDCRALNLDKPAAFFLEHAKVAVNEGAAFGTPGVGFVRLNFATSAAILEQIITRMGAAAKAR